MKAFTRIFNPRKNRTFYVKCDDVNNTSEVIQSLVGKRSIFIENKPEASIEYPIGVTVSVTADERAAIQKALEIENGYCISTI